MTEQADHDTAGQSTAVDISLATAKQAARAAALAADNLELAARATTRRHADRWRIAGYSAMQEARILVRRSMSQLAAELGASVDTGQPGMEPAALDERAAVLAFLRFAAERAATLTEGNALAAAADALETLAHRGGAS